MINEKTNLMNIWETDFRIICHAHYDSAVRHSRRNYQLGLPVVVLSAIVGTTVFATLNENPETWARIIVGMLSLTTVVMASLQTFLKFSERAEKHKEAGARFGALLKEVEQYIALPPKDDAELKNWCDSLRARWDKLSLESPTVPKDIWKKHHFKNKGLLQQKIGVDS